MTSTLDAQLVASGQGDGQAFSELYDASAPRVFGLALRIVSDPGHSADVTQEVFVEAWRTAARFDPERGSALSWLVALTHHRAVDRFRLLESQPRTAPDQRRFRLAARAPGIGAALAALSPARRQALELAYFGGYTHREVAGLLHVPIDTMRARIRDALRQVRDVSPTTTRAPA